MKGVRKGLWEIYELAKKINYETAVYLYENEYAVQIANARIGAFELFYIKELKDKDSKNTYATGKISFIFASSNVCQGDGSTPSKQRCH